MERKDRIPASYDKLKKALKEKNTGITSASRKMGYDATFLSKELAAGDVRRSIAITIEALFGIKPEDYAPDTKPTSEPEKQVTTESKPVMSAYDRISLDKASKAIEDLRLTVNEQKNQIKALTDVLERMTEHMAHFDALFGDPMKLYRSIFIPMYNGIRACENDKAAERERKIDGTLKVVG